MRINGWNRRLGSLILFLAAFLLAGGTCLACTSGLIVIPTAETVPHEEYDIEPQIDGVMNRLDADTWIINTQFGLTSRLAAGADFQWANGEDPQVLFNFQYLLVPGSDRSPAVAAGSSSIGCYSKHGEFVVATQELDGRRAHIGIQRYERKSRWFVGADYAASDRLVLMADYTDGPENCSSVGFCWHQQEGLDVQVGAIFPNSSGDDTRFSLALVLTGPVERR